MLLAVLPLLLGGCVAARIPAARTEVPHPLSATVIIAGDAMAHEAQLAEQDDDPGAFGAQLAGLSSTIGSSDLAVGNVETLITTESPSGNPASFGAPPSFAAALAATGFRVVGVANNHATDRGLAGFRASQSLLAAAGLVPVGGERSVAYGRVPGGTVAVLSATALTNAPAFPGGPLAYGSRELTATLLEARSRATAVVVLLHDGREYHGRPDARLRSHADALLALGADVVAISHPHVAGPVERRGTGWVAWSLGNCLNGRPLGFGGSSAVGGVDFGLLLRLRLVAGRVTGVEAIPVFRELVSGRVRMVPLEKAQGRQAGLTKPYASRLLGRFLAWE